MLRFSQALLLGLAVLCPKFVQAQERMIHDPVIYHEDGVYYMYSTGHGITIRRSKDMFRWEGAGRVFSEDVPAWAAEEIPGTEFPWAPDISFFNGQYHLYYSISTFGENKSCIGLATNETLDPASPKYRWEDHGKVVESRAEDNFNAIDPNVVLDAKGSPWLSFGSFWTGLKLVAIDQGTGKPSPQGGNLISIASRPPPTAIEAPFIVRKNGYYYLFASFDFCCRGADSTYNVRVGRSENIEGPYLDRKGDPMLSGGGTPLIKGYDNVRGPGSTQIMVVDGKEFHVGHWYDANENGVPRLGVRPLVWAEDGWPLVGEMLKGPYDGPTELSGQELEAAIVGEWNHSVDFGPAFSLNFLEGGKMAGSSATWQLLGDQLTLRFPDPAAPGGVWVNECVLADDGTWYAGRYGPGDGIIIRGSKVGVVPEPGTLLLLLTGVCGLLLRRRRAS